MKGTTFAAYLYILALCGLFVGGGELFSKLHFDLNAEVGVMKSDDPVLARTMQYNPTGGAIADVRYETSHGTVPVHGLHLLAGEVHKLAQGESIPLRYMRSDPSRYLKQGDEMPSGIGWLVMGFVSLGVAIFAHRLLRREAGGT